MAPIEARLQRTVLIAFASASVAMMKWVPLSKIAVVALSPGTGFAAAFPMLTDVRFTDQYFCTAATCLEAGPQDYTDQPCPCVVVPLPCSASSAVAADSVERRNA